MTGVLVVTTSPAATEALGAGLGRLLAGGEFIGLVGDLGSGKTTFVRGLVRGIGEHGDVDVTSPTFTLHNVYPCRLPVDHIDLYRLPPGTDFRRLGLREASEPSAVAVVEWADRFPEAIPPDHLRIEFRSRGSRREILVSAGGPEHARLLREGWPAANPTPP